ncbi:MAG: type VI secretion system membrane subunit TssM [Pseudomonadota bacterium]
MLRFLVSRWFLGALGLIALSLLIYYLGDQLALGSWRPLASELARVICVFAIIIIWLVRRIFALLNARKTEQQLVQGVMEAPLDAAQPPDMSAQEVETLNARFEEAIGVLKASKGKRGAVNLYDLPWYIIIGPPGAGKTTALLNSGLHFPLAERFGPDAVRGIGGTRDCDWWFTDDAVMIDTAGRYTTQDSDASVDQAAWLGFLNLLKKHRKRRPINGILVAISVTDLLTQDERERAQHVKAVRGRVQELENHFGIRFPVYVMFTKCDLLSGFSEFFDDLGRGDREQVWGCTFPFDDSPEANPLGQFDGEFDALLTRLGERAIDRIQQEGDPGRRILIHGFPRQVALLKDMVGGFLRDVFQGNRYESAPLLRGFYLVSGTQEGTPVDRLLGSLAQAFRLDAHAMPVPQGSGKSFFIKDLLQKVVFNESELAGTNLRLERRLSWLKHGAYAGLAGLVLVATGLWFFGYSGARSDIERAGTLASEAIDASTAVTARDLDPLAAMPALELAEQIPGGHLDSIEGERPWRFGLSQDDKIGVVARSSYRRLSEQLYLPRILLRLENQLRRGGSSPDYTYEALKAYLMLDSRGPYNADEIRGFLEYDWIENLRREVDTEQRASLVHHLDALLEQPVKPLPLPLDDSVISFARREIRGLPLESRIYGRLKRSMSRSGEGFSVRRAAGGSQAELVFVRKSGASLGEPLNPMFTKAVYQGAFTEANLATTDRIADEAWWILGEEQELDPTGRKVLLDKVRDLYLEDFASEYSNLILDIGLAPFDSPESAARLFAVLSSQDDSPLLKLLNAIAAETSLDEPGPDASIATRVESGANRALEYVQDVLGSRGIESETVTELVARNDVSRRFENLNRLVRGEDDAPKPIERLLELFNELYVYMRLVASESAEGAIPPQVQANGKAVLQQLRIESDRQPDMLVGEMIDTSVERSVAITTGGLRSYLNEQWRSGPLGVCRQAIADRYPIATGNRQTIRLDDFGRFFGYGGTVDNFFSTHLRQYVDTTRSPWRTRQTGNVPIRLSADALRAFEYADVVKRTFFRPGSMQPSVGFDLRPLEADTSLSQFLLNLEGKQVSYAFGPQDSTYMQWPGPNPGAGVRLEVRDRSTGQTQMQRLDGPWAWFRLLDASSMQRTAVPEQFEVEFTVQGRGAVYSLIARSAFNPFALNQLRDFRCPARL